MVLCDNSSKFLNKEFGAESVKIPNFVDESIIACKEKYISENVNS